MRRRVGSAIGIALLAVMAGCSVGPKYKVPTAATPQVYKEADPATYKEAGDWKPAQPSDAALRGDWWTLFGDDELNSLEQQINPSNQTLKAAQARFEQARALIRFNRSGRFPTLTIGGDISTNRGSANRTLAAPGSTKNYGDFVLPLDLSYEVDAWGRIGNAIEAARAEAQASSADLETIRLSLHTELAYDYFELRSLDAEQQLLNDTVRAYERALELTRNRFQGGAASGVEVAQAQTQLDSTRAQAQDVSVQRAAYEHAIATLIGKPPAMFALAAKPWKTAPPSIPAGLPSQLLERRPDIAAAERRVDAANAQIGIARSAYYPTVLLSAAAGLEGGSITSWLNWPSRFWAVGPTLLQTIFDGGRRRANSEAARAAYDAAVANYRQTTLDAFQQVEDNLAALRILAQETETERTAVAAAERWLQLAMNRYRGGLVTYLEVVTAQSSALANERTAVAIQRRRMNASVLLVKALGGGWNSSQLPPLKQ